MKMVILKLFRTVFSFVFFFLLVFIRIVKIAAFLDFNDSFSGFFVQTNG